MTDRERTITKLKILRTWCVVNPNHGKGLCVEDCRSAVEWLDDVLALLKTQEPRVMTLDEAQHALHNDIVVWIELKSEIFSGLFCGIRKDGTNYFTMQNDDVLSVTDLDDGNNAKLYGKCVRAWTFRPDEKVRAETAWQSDT